MNWYSVLQNIITWALTGFSVICFTWAARTAKRITILEEHDKAAKEALHEQANQAVELDKKLDKIADTQIEMVTKLDLILNGKISVRKESSK